MVSMQDIAPTKCPGSARTPWNWILRTWFVLAKKTKSPFESSITSTSSAPAAYMNACSCTPAKQKLFRRNESLISVTPCFQLHYALTFEKVETDRYLLGFPNPVSRPEIAERAHFLQSHHLAALCDVSGCAQRRGESEGIGRSGERGGEGDGALALYDLRQLTGGLVARQFAALHPNGLVSVVLVDGGDDTFAMVESLLRSIAIEPLPVAEHDSGLATLNQVGH